MTQEPRHIAHIMSRRKMWNLFVLIGFAIAALGFLMLPVAIGWFPVAPILIVGGFSLSLAAYVGRRLRVYMLKKIRQEEREEAHTLLD